jgi:hypothetical protein
MTFVSQNHVDFLRIEWPADSRYVRPFLITKKPLVSPHGSLNFFRPLKRTKLRENESRCLMSVSQFFSAAFTSSASVWKGTEREYQHLGYLTRLRSVVGEREIRLSRRVVISRHSAFRSNFLYGKTPVHFLVRFVCNHCVPGKRSPLAPAFPK